MFESCITLFQREVVTICSIEGLNTGDDIWGKKLKRDNKIMIELKYSKSKYLYYIAF